MSRSSAKVRAMKSCQNFSQRMYPSTPLNPKLMFHSVLYYFCAFGTVRLRYKTQCENGPNCCQKFVPRSRVGIFRNERNRSTPLDCKLLFRCVLYYLDAFRTIWLLYKTRRKRGWSGAKVRAMMSGRNFSQGTHPIHPLDSKLMFRCVSYYFFAFETVCCVTTLRSIRAKPVQKFVPRSRVGIFRNERTRSTPLAPKLTFWCILYYLGRFGTVWLPYETGCKTGRTSAKVRATRSRWIFSQRTHPIQPIGP